MNLAAMSLGELSGPLLGFVLTLFILSYAIGDNVLFRLATHIFVGVAAGYAVIITLYNVILPQLIFPFIEGSSSERFLAISLLVPCILILFKLSPRLSKLGNPAIAILVGIGAAAAIGGATFGTIFPQTTASINVFSSQQLTSFSALVNALLLLFGTITTLLYFQFNTRKRDSRNNSISMLFKFVGWLGKGFIAITFGALFAGVYVAALTALIERFSFLSHFINDLLIP